MVKKKEESSSKSEKKVKEVKTVDLESKEIDIDLSEIKNDLTDYMKSKIDTEVEKAVDKSTKKLIRYKNSIILKKNITIIILIIICAFLSYNLYKISNININVSTTKKSTQKLEQKKTVKTEEKEETKEKELENKKKEYKHLIDDIYINDDSTYIKDFYEGNLTDEIKLYLAMNNINEDKVVSEDDSIYIEEDDIKESYDNFFNTDFTPKSFEYNNLKFHYLSSKSMFISNGKFEKVKNNILKEIIDINEDKELIITTVEGILKDDKLYNIVNQKEIKNYKNDSLEKYKDDLTIIHYYFEKDEDDYKLVKITN
ncbi:MAG: hypothetical protein IKE90_03910 [Bacilli bacterium]|nr:hypothetical protein [Bacilli bacterium]